MRGPMFTGLVETVAEVLELRPLEVGRRLVLQAPRDGSTPWTALGDSVSVAGCCLTVVGYDGRTIEFDAGPETLSRTTLGTLRPGDGVNLERSLRVGDRMGGHFVTGHVDLVGTIDAREDQADWSTLWFRIPPAWMPQIVSKGSVALDGVSLTVVDVADARFSVQLIPHTLAVTTFGRRRAGDQVHVETDLLAKYIAAQLHATQLAAAQFPAAQLLASH